MKIFLLSVFLLTSCQHGPLPLKQIRGIDNQTSTTKISRHKGRYWLYVETDSPIRAWVALPLNRQGQSVKLGKVVPEPSDRIVDPLTGTTVIIWEAKPSREKLVFYYDFEVSNSPVNFKIDPAIVQLPGPDTPEVKRFTISEPWLEQSDKIKAKTKEIVGNQTNPYLQAKLIFDWVVKEMTYDYPAVPNLRK